MRISKTMLRELQALADGRQKSNITSHTFKALENRGLAEWKLSDNRSWGGYWSITKAGREVLTTPARAAE